MLIILFMQRWILPFRRRNKDGTVCVDSKLIIPYLKSFGDTVNVHVGDFIALNSGNKSISAEE